MTDKKDFDVIIVGGSYAGLSAAMALGRALRNVLIIDSGLPCNRQTPHSHNFLTQDGKTPGEISVLAKEQVLKYNTVHFRQDVATAGKKVGNGFEITTQSSRIFTAQKLLFATGIKDVMPDIKGFTACWGISVIHCPYCHGYEVRNEKTGILGNGDHAFEYAKLISNWTKDLTLFTNGKSALTGEQTKKLQVHNIPVIETGIDRFEHKNGYIEQIIFRDGTASSIKAVYSKVPFIQHCDIPEKLGCELTEQGYIKTGDFQKTTVDGVYACGDNISPMRSVSTAIATGTFAGAAINKELIEEQF
ncbi:NAD(P)/FAD-dependent oxidoreductase [Ilyomonas limi]|uniref:NAD(P)/FAD-dependent oxidoreductase n=1 Tax=Ilyomonas limi TaxID=2575867 RepID=A0A4U3L3V5_9BACT|nr:NAD(P)/FAD-dependent oxidoreductase [Ilyomonas limi]TKK68989.1 NAD(P)/FAD-dependent oxidoreductase [Ilyomonas limi]